MKFNLDYIDAMRGIAVLMVLFVHSTMFFSLYDIENLPFHFERFLFSGKYGVILFFLVSSYTLFRSLDLRKEDGFKNYYIRRFFRIAPLYYLVLIVLFFLTSGNDYFMLDDSSGISLTNLLSHIIFINGFSVNYFNSIIGVEWTIFVEISFYIILSIIYIYKNHLNKILFFSLILSILVYLLSKILIYENLYRIQLHFSPLTWLFVFFLGGVIYFNEKNKKIKNLVVTYKKIIMFSTLSLIGIFSYLQLPGNYIVFSFLLALFFMLNMYNRIIIFNNIVLRKIGKISFSVYLLHMPLFVYVKNKMGRGNYDMVIFNNIFLSYSVLSFVLILNVLLLSMFTYKFIEKPFIKLGKKYILSRQNNKYE